MKVSFADSFNEEELNNPELKEALKPLLDYINSMATDLTRLTRNQINRSDNMATSIKSFPLVHGVAKTIQVGNTPIGAIPYRCDHGTDRIISYKFRNLSTPGQVEMTVYFAEESTESRTVAFEFPTN